MLFNQQTTSKFCQMTKYNRQNIETVSSVTSLEHLATNLYKHTNKLLCMPYSEV